MMSCEQIAGMPPWLTESGKGVNAGHRETIALVFDRYLEGQGVASIATELNKSRRPNWRGETQWLPSQVRELLTDRRLLGEEGRYPAAIDAELFNRVQEKLAGNLAKGAGLDQVTKRVSSCLAPRHIP